MFVTHIAVRVFVDELVVIDTRIGVDKRYGKAGDEAPVFYTSIKPWAQKASDMRDFPGFLDFGLAFVTVPYDGQGQPKAVCKLVTRDECIFKSL